MTAHGLKGRLRPLSASIAGTLAAAIALALLPAAAEAEPRRAFLVIDGNTGKVLDSRDADEPRYPASLTKMMTLYMAFELIEKGRLSYNSRIKISQEAANAAPSKLELDPGEDISVLDAVKALVTKSANDIAVALAEHIGGSETNFARLMTKKAREIGMSHTTFKNASGLPDNDQTTTARDMLTLALRLQDDFPEHYKHFATRTFTYNGSSYRNHNSLLRNFRGTDGIKTGYTRASGFNLVSSVRLNGKHVVGVVFGGRTAAARDSDMRAMLTRALAKASTSKTRKPVLVAAPRPAVRPQPAAIARSMPAPQANPGRPPAQQPATAPLATAQPEPPAAVVEPRIEVARVRRVMVAPHERRATVSEEGATTPPLGGADRAVAAADEPLPTPTAEPANPRLAFATGGQLADIRQPSTLQDQLAALIAADGQVGPGNSPAPEQVAAAQTSAQPAYHLKGPVTPASFAGAAAASPPARAATQGGNFEIQVGAYGSLTEAERQIDFVRARADAVLAGHDGATPQVQKGNRTFYRARFAGFSSTKAADACIELRRRAIDCFVMKAN